MKLLLSNLFTDKARQLKSIGEKGRLFVKKGVLLAKY